MTFLSFLDGQKNKCTRLRDGNSSNIATKLYYSEMSEDSILYLSDRVKLLFVAVDRTTLAAAFCMC